MNRQGLDVYEQLETASPEEGLPEWALDIPDREMFSKEKTVTLKIQLLPRGEFKTIRAKLSDTIGHLMVETARVFGEVLLPPAPNVPFDKFFCYGPDDKLIGPLEDLSVTLLQVLRQHRCRRKFGLELALALKVNANWKVAPKDSMTPKEILVLFGMDPSQFTLYAVGSSEPFPLDHLIEIKRGSCFEALRDGRYGGGLR